MKKVFVLLFILICVTAQSQNRQGPGIGDRMEREKKMLYDSLPTLTADQKLLIDHVYSEVTAEITALRESGDRSAFREKLTEIQQNKNDAFRDILSDEQFKKYTEMMERMRNQFRGRNQRDQ